MKKHFLFAIPIVLGITFFGCLFPWGSPTAPSPSPKQSVIPTKVSPIILQQEFFERNIRIPLEQAMKDYPVEPIRVRLKKLGDRTKSGEIKLVCVASPQKWLGASDMTKTNPMEIQLCIPNLMMANMMWEGNEKAFLDLVITILLHEEYHLDQHHIRHHNGKRIPSHKAESEAWWFLIEQIAIPMVQKGRLKRVQPLLREGIYARRDGGFKQNSKTWNNFIKRVVETSGRESQHD